jgi:crotonobetaine/carnitine-CoA ligase
MTAWRSDSESDTVIDLLRQCVDDCPDQPFVEFGFDTYTYSDVWNRATRLAAGLRAHGVGSERTVATMFDNHVDALCSWLGVNLAGGIWVGLNTALRGKFLRHVVADTKTDLLLCEGEFLERIAFIEEGLPDLRTVLWRGGDGNASDMFTRVATDSFESCRLDASDQGWCDPKPADTSCLVYTGGTTGPSKGCIISHNQICNIARRTNESSGRTSDEVNWNPLPIFHLNLTATTIVASMLVRGSASIPNRFSLSGFWPDMLRTGARVVNLLGSMGSFIAHMPESPEMAACAFGQIRVLYGSPFPPELESIWRKRFGVELVGNVYGQTEAVPQTTLHHQMAREAPPGSSGKRNDDDFDVRIFDEIDRELGPNQIGEVVCRPKRPHVMYKGYWGRPEATWAAMQNLWFHTGDLGRFDDEGFFYFVDRKKDYLRRRGENISSSEMEAVFSEHPAIAEVAVHAVPSEISEDDVKVTAVLVDDHALTALELFEWSKTRVPYFALPRYIEFRPELPKSPTGRVHKYILRDEGCTETTWDREHADVVWERR